jgi:hypothetical protein
MPRIVIVPSRAATLPWPSEQMQPGLKTVTSGDLLFTSDEALRANAIPNFGGGYQVVAMTARSMASR